MCTCVGQPSAARGPVLSKSPFPARGTEGQKGEGPALLAALMSQSCMADVDMREPVLEAGCEVNSGNPGNPKKRPNPKALFLRDIAFAVYRETPW